MRWSTLAWVAATTSRRPPERRWWPIRVFPAPRMGAAFEEAAEEEEGADKEDSAEEPRSAADIRYAPSVSITSDPRCVRNLARDTRLHTPPSHERELLPVFFYQKIVLHSDATRPAPRNRTFARRIPVHPPAVATHTGQAHATDCLLIVRRCTRPPLPLVKPARFDYLVG